LNLKWFMPFIHCVITETQV